MANGKGLEKELDPGVFAEFIGWYIAEGCCDSDPKCPGNGYRVTLSQRHAPKRILLQALLDQLPWHWTASRNGFSCSSKQLWTYLHPYGNVYSKRVPQWIRDAAPEVIRRYLVGAVLGDGNVQHGRRNYATVSPLLADDVQELFIKLGCSASVRVRPASEYTIQGRTGQSRPLYIVSEWTVPFGGLRDSKNRPNFESVPYDGPVYCASVPNGTLIVRRNGKPFVAGNCLEYLAAYNPGYFPPKSPRRVISPGYRMWQDFQEHDQRKRGFGGDGLHLGPGSGRYTQPSHVY